MTSPSTGRIVHYTLTQEDADRINKRREDFKIHLDRDGYQDTGYIAHFGPVTQGGDVLPMIITYAIGGSDVINGQVFLDGSDTLWVRAASKGPDLGQWEWPVIAR